MESWWKLRNSCYKMSRQKMRLRKLNCRVRMKTFKRKFNLKAGHWMHNSNDLDNNNKKWCKIITWQIIHIRRTCQSRVQILMISLKYNSLMGVSPNKKDFLKLRKLKMLSMNRLHLMVIEMYQMSHSLTMMESNNFSKYNKATMTQHPTPYNQTHTNNGKRSTINNYNLKNKQIYKNKSKPNLKYISNQQTTKFTKTTQIMKYGRTIIISIHTWQKLTLTKLIVIKITVGRVKSNIMIVGRKILMVFKWRKWILIKIVRTITKSKLTPVKTITKISPQIMRKINSYFSPSKSKTKSPVIGAITMIKINKQVFLRMPGQGLQIDIQTLQI